MKTCVLILDNLRSVENTGSIFRTADGLGVRKIYCIGTTPTPLDRFGRKRNDFVKVSLGAENIDWSYAKEITAVIKELKEQGFKIIALEQDERSQPLQAVSSKLQTFALIVGNEVEGVSKDALDFCDHIAEISMQGEKESLNVAVATGIALYTIMR
jgi:23S rRNA (guanosine2251-2'-O)-methyltransferase